MLNLNQHRIAGNLARNPELRYTQSGQPVLNMRLISNRSWKDQNGKRQERSQGHNVVIWGQRAAKLAKHLQKGTGLYVEGRMETRTYERKMKDTEGNDVTVQYPTIETVVDFGGEVQFLTPRPQGSAETEESPETEESDFSDDDE